MNFKKILIAVLSIALLLSLAACGGKAPTTAPSEGSKQNFDPEAKGMLFLSMGAEIKVTYDNGGLVMSVDAANEAGQEILEKCPVNAGTACDVAVADLIKATVDASTSDLKVIMIKQAFGSESPSDKFLEDVRVDAEAAAGSCAVLVVDVASLTAEGYLSADTVKAIFLATIGEEEANVTVSEELTNGIYFVTHKTEEATSNYTVDADTGAVTFQEEEGTVEDLPEEETGDEYYDPGTEPEMEEPQYEEPMTDPVFPEDTNPVEPDITEATEDPFI